MTTYGKYSASSEKPREKEKKRLGVFEIQCITVLIIAALLVGFRYSGLQAYEVVRAFFTGIFDTSGNAQTSSALPLISQLAEAIGGSFASNGKSSVPAESSLSDISQIPASSLPLGMYEKSLDDLLTELEKEYTPNEINISEYRMNEEAVTVYGGDLIPISLLTSTDSEKADSFAQKANGGLLKAPDGCSFDPYFVTLNAPISGSVTSEFGYRYHPITGLFGFHTGVDIATYSGAPVYSSGAGSVVKRGYDDVWGNFIIIDHGNGIQTFYAHCKKLVKNLGAYVKSGEKIALVGSTGWSTGPHLHFEVRISDVRVDPMWIL